MNNPGVRFFFFSTILLNLHVCCCGACSLDSLVMKNFHQASSVMKRKDTCLQKAVYLLFKFGVFRLRVYGLTIQLLHHRISKKNNNEVNWTQAHRQPLCVCTHDGEWSKMTQNRYLVRSPMLEQILHCCICFFFPQH